MKSIQLQGVNALGEPARINAEVHHFTGKDDYFKAVNKGSGNLELTTPKGVYLLKRHPSQNIFMGTCGGRKVHISLKKVVGELRFW